MRVEPLSKQHYTELPTSADNVTLLAFAAKRRSIKLVGGNVHMIINLLTKCI